MKIKKFILVPTILIVSTILSSCGEAPRSFIDLPAPVDGQYPTAEVVQTVGDTQDVQLVSPLIDVVYRETGQGTGSIGFEKVVVAGKSSAMVKTSWGDYLNADIQLTQSHDSTGNLVEGRITMTLKGASLLQVLHGCLSCIIDRSRLVFLYISPKPGEKPVLTQVKYFEEWGADSQGILAMGLNATWDDAATKFPQYSEWGFWEDDSLPFDQVTRALDIARGNLATEAPTMLVIDRDSAKEIIGRQTGLVLEANGQPYGNIDFVYKNNWGRMPNTEFIGRGALSRIEWYLNGEYHALVVLSPALSPRPTTLFVFVDDSTTADYVENLGNSNWVTLYDMIRNKSLKGVTFAVYANGYIGKITGSDSDGKSIDIGEGGGVYFSAIGDVSNKNVSNARNLLAIMGIGGIKATGFYYATENLSGNGLDYYLATLILATSDKELVLDQYGQDVGVLDRVGYADFSRYPQLPK